MPLDDELEGMIAKTSRKAAGKANSSKLPKDPSVGRPAPKKRLTSDGLNFRTRAEKIRKRGNVDTKLSEVETLHAMFKSDDVFELKGPECAALVKDLEKIDVESVSKYYRDATTGGVTEEGIQLLDRISQATLLVTSIQHIVQSIHASDDAAESSGDYLHHLLDTYALLPGCSIPLKKLHMLTVKRLGISCCKGGAYLSGLELLRQEVQPTELLPRTLHALNLTPEQFLECQNELLFSMFTFLLWSKENAEQFHQLLAVMVSKLGGVVPDGIMDELKAMETITQAALGDGPLPGSVNAVKSLAATITHELKLSRQFLTLPCGVHVKALFDAKMAMVFRDQIASQDIARIMDELKGSFHANIMKTGSVDRLLLQAKRIKSQSKQLIDALPADARQGFSQSHAESFAHMAMALDTIMLRLGEINSQLLCNGLHATFIGVLPELEKNEQATVKVLQDAEPKISTELGNVKSKLISCDRIRAVASEPQLLQWAYFLKRATEHINVLGYASPLITMGHVPGASVTPYQVEGLVYQVQRFGTVQTIRELVKCMGSEGDATEEGKSWCGSWMRLCAMLRIAMERYLAKLRGTLESKQSWQSVVKVYPRLRNAKPDKWSIANLAKGKKVVDASDDGDADATSSADAGAKAAKAKGDHGCAAVTTTLRLFRLAGVGACHDNSMPSLTARVRASMLRTANYCVCTGPAVLCALVVPFPVCRLHVSFCCICTSAGQSRKMCYRLRLQKQGT